MGSGFIRLVHFFFLFFVELGAGKIDPDPSRHVAAVVVALTQESIVVDFNCAFDFALFSGQFDDFTPPLFSLRVAVFTESAVRQGIGGLITFRAEHDGFLKADSPVLSRAVWQGCVCLIGLVVRRGGDLDVPRCRNDLGSTGHAVVVGQNLVDVLAELESHCLLGPAAFREGQLESER